MIANPERRNELNPATVIRIFNVYYPVRTLILVMGEAAIVYCSFLVATLLQAREESYFALNDDYGYYKLVISTIFILLLSHWLDFYDPAVSEHTTELYFRVFLIPGLLALSLAVLGAMFPGILRNFSFGLGILIATLGLFSWRSAYIWLAKMAFLKERVYVLGTGQRAQRLIQGLQDRVDLGIEVVGWTGEVNHPLTRENMAAHLERVAADRQVHRVIVAIEDRRGSMPVDQLLELRLRGAVRIEDATSWLERISGRIEIEHLHPSWLIYAEGFRHNETVRLGRRMLDLIVSLIGVLLSAPLVPFIALAIKLDSKGPVLYRQHRVGRRGRVFHCYKFRTMRRDAEADLGPTWAGDDDPRITRVGRYLRATRLDEIPQLWCVLRGDMAFVGPRPERPEFVDCLCKQIPYYQVRHVVHPGITGWAQIRYKYGNTVADAKEKLQYDLFYIKNASIGLDLMILFQTIKIVLLRRGA